MDKPTYCQTCGKGPAHQVYSVREYQLFQSSEWLCYTCAVAAGWVKPAPIVPIAREETKRMRAYVPGKITLPPFEEYDQLTLDDDSWLLPPQGD